MQNPIIAALDVPTAEQALKLAQAVASAVGAFKIGKELFVAAGPDIVKRVRDTGASVFLDLKFHDIPNTVAKAVASAVRLDVQMLTIHTCGGSAMMRAAEESAQQTALQSGRNAPLVLGVTVLTSLDRHALAAEVGVSSTVEAHVLRLAARAQEAGLDGCVASPREIAPLRLALGPRWVIVTPGIRPADRADDQRRTATPGAAIRSGADHLVVGRPITAAPDPSEAARAILEEIARASGS
jgi:orotidine-5'-phosphate decarboxylase